MTSTILDPVGDETPPPADGEPTAPPTFTRSYRRLVIVLGVMLLLAIVGLIIWLTSPYDPEATNLQNRMAGPSSAHPMGTDDLGRDVMVRLVIAGGVSLRAAAQAVLTAGIIGIPTGLIAGYRGGLVDAILSRIVDALMSLPALLVALTVVAVLGPGLNNAMFAVGIAYSPQLFRVIRSVTIAVNDEEFVKSAEVAGAGTWWVIRRHVLPNIIGYVLVNLALLAGLAILLESGLSFLGLGVLPPTPSWGIMLSRAYAHVYDQALTMLFPGVMIIVAVLLFNSLADAVRDVLIGTQSEDR